MLGWMGSSFLATPAQHRELNWTSPKPHCISRAWRPNVDAPATDHAAGIGDKIIATVGACCYPHTRPQRQVTRVRGNQTFGDHLSTRRSAAQTVGSGNVGCWWSDVSFFTRDPFTQISARWEFFEGNGCDRFSGG